MKLYRSILLAGIIAATFATTAVPVGTAAEKGARVYPMDCAKWKDKARCATLNQNIKACKDKTDDDWLECMHLPTPIAKFRLPKPRDCSKARNEELCKAYNAALEACKDKLTRAEHRKCVAAQVHISASTKN
jgi:hypothetical protein